MLMNTKQRKYHLQDRAGREANISNSVQSALMSGFFFLAGAALQHTHLSTSLITIDIRFVQTNTTCHLPE